MDSKAIDPLNDLIAAEDAATQAQAQQHAPPSYQASTNDIPNPNLNLLNLNLSFTPLPLPLHTITLLMTGESRSPNFTVTIPQNPHATSNDPTDTPLAHIDTDSTLVHHHTHIRDARPGGVMYTLKRQQASSSPGGGGDGSGPGIPNGAWRYSITAHGSAGARLLEVTTTPEILRAASTRLVFRRAGDGELDALRLKTHKYGEQEGGLSMVVEYRGGRVGEVVVLEGGRIQGKGSREKKPVLRVSVEVGGVDPLLVVVLALVVDDRWMGDKRRYKREFGRGFAGIGKGPGAGLAGAFALG